MNDWQGFLEVAGVLIVLATGLFAISTARERMRKLDRAKFHNRPPLAPDPPHEQKRDERGRFMGD